MNRLKKKFARWLAKRWLGADWYRLEATEDNCIEIGDVLASKKGASVLKEHAKHHPELCVRKVICQPVKI